jgi:hypothetical protein
MKCPDLNHTLALVITHDTIKNAKDMNVSNISAVWDVKYAK